MSVCPLAYLRSHWLNFANLLRMLIVAVAWSSGGVAIYVIVFRFRG